MSKHTPGPWALDAEAKHPWIVTCPVEGFPELPGKVCEVGYLPNARMIAAAPETYASLRAMTDWVKAALNCKDWHWDGDQREAAEFELATALAAIAKAEGRS